MQSEGGNEIKADPLFVMYGYMNALSSFYYDVA